MTAESGSEFDLCLILAELLGAKIHMQPQTESHGMQFEVTIPTISHPKSGGGE